jgi:hypothetical protein
MRQYVLESEEFERLMKKLDTIEEKLNNTSPMDEDMWFDNEQVCNYLQISKRTLQSYKNKDLIEYRQVGAKIWYKYQWVIDFLEKHGKP